MANSFFVIRLTGIEFALKKASFVLFELWWFNTLVLIPSMYVLNTDKVKEYLNGIKWYGALIERFRSRKVAPIPNQLVEMNVLPNVSTTSKSKDIINEASFTAKQNSRKLWKSASDIHILKDVKVFRRKMSI